MSYNASSCFFPLRLEALLAGIKPDRFLTQRPLCIAFHGSCRSPPQPQRALHARQRMCAIHHGADASALSPDRTRAVVPTSRRLRERGTGCPAGRRRARSPTTLFEAIVTWEKTECGFGGAAEAAYTFGRLWTGSRRYKVGRARRRAVRLFASRSAGRRRRPRRGRHPAPAALRAARTRRAKFETRHGRRRRGVEFGGRGRGRGRAAGPARGPLRRRRGGCVGLARLGLAAGSAAAGAPRRPPALGACALACRSTPRAGRRSLVIT